ncbi:MAG: GNAT family N-acetyltransferase [Chloroflexi bacterium]|nr:GNAT family N-acetyltransferase [Chloroflexota bacterium]
MSRPASSSAHPWQIRAAAEGDIAGIIPLLNEVQTLHHLAEPDIFVPSSRVQSPDAEIRGWLADPACLMWVAVEDDTVLGVLLLKQTAAHSPKVIKCLAGNIEAVAVKEGWRSQGIGRSLLEHAEQVAAELGWQRLSLKVWEFNQRAVGLYEKAGYRTAQRMLIKDLR